MPHRRKCPDCGTEMIEKVVKNFSVSICPTCGGVWFKKDEIKKISDTIKNMLEQFFILETELDFEEEEEDEFELNFEEEYEEDEEEEEGYEIQEIIDWESYDWDEHDVKG